MRKLLLPLSLVVALTAPLAAAELAGVTLAPEVTVGGQNLVLNGMGIRKKLFIKVYVAGLYLPAKESDGAKVLAADTPRRTVMHILYSLESKQLCEGWEEGLANNTPGASAEVKAQFDTLCSYMEAVPKGQELVFTYEPEVGTRVEVKGQEKGVVPGKPFADALFACWLGPKPPGEDFKKGLLGG